MENPCEIRLLKTKMRENLLEVRRSKYTIGGKYLCNGKSVHGKK